MAGSFHTRTLAGILAVLALVTSTLEAQIHPGDLLFSVAFRDQLGVVDVVRGKATTFSIAYSQFSLKGLVPAGDGVHVCAVRFAEKTCQGYQPRVLRIDPVTGSRSTLQVVPTQLCHNRVAGLVRDQDGSFLYAGGGYQQGEVWRVGSQAAKHLITVPFLIDSITRDADTGDLVLALADGVMKDHLVRMTPAGVLTTFATTGSRAAIAHDAISGHFWDCSRTYANSSWEYALKLVDRQKGTVVTSLRTWYQPRAMAVDDVSGDMFLDVEFHGIARMARDGTMLRIFPIPHVSVNSIMIWGARPLAGAGPATPGSTYSVHARFPGSPNRPYFAAASLGGLRPRIPYPTGGIPIAIDGLLLWTLGRDIPGLTSGFAGTLDSRGCATMTLTIPLGAPKGLVITMAAVATNPTRPARLDVGSSMTVVVR